MVNGNGNRPRGSEGTVPVPVQARRALAQAGLVAALLAVFTVCAAAAGTCALLLTAGSERALSAAVALADGTAAGGEGPADGGSNPDGHDGGADGTA